MLTCCLSVGCYGVHVVLLLHLDKNNNEVLNPPKLVNWLEVIKEIQDIDRGMI